jgi:hypothetical protein
LLIEKKDLLKPYVEALGEEIERNAKKKNYKY